MNDTQFVKGAQLFIKGEALIFDFKITSKVAAPIVVSSAVWELKKRGSVICRGSCDIDGDNISMLVPMQVAGDLVIEVRAEIPPETIIRRFDIKVVE